MKKRRLDIDEFYLKLKIKEPVRTQHFKDLERGWYAKLYKEGFKDIESSKGHRPLNAWHNLRFNGADVTQRQNAEEYYHDAKELLNTYPFKSPIERLIWHYHALGLSKRKIEAKISHLPDNYKREQIGNFIRLIAREIKK